MTLWWTKSGVSAVTDLFSNSEHSLQALIEEAPVVELVNNLLAQAVDSGASDIHVEPEELRFTVRMRVDGVLHTHMVQPAERYPAIGSRIKLIAGLDIAEAFATGWPYHLAPKRSGYGYPCLYSAGCSW